MSNSYFRFKQFMIEQERCAMKVTTDACIQGAWTPVLPGVKRVLDIGAGTGLLSLMLAQRNTDIFIDAIEFDHEAAGQARDNVNSSLWKERINIIEGDVRNYLSSHKFDLIITNPPFFSSSLLSDEAKKNMARHNLSLTYADLLKAIEDNLAADGYVSILLPYSEYLIWRSLCEKIDWFEIGKLSVMHRPEAGVKRVVGLFSKKKSFLNEQTLIIQDDEDKYSPEFTRLLSPFYLAL